MQEKVDLTHFEQFGGRMYFLMILTIVSLILAIIAIFIEFVVIIVAIIHIIIFFTFLSALGDIKKAGQELNNENLLAFHSKIILGLILLIIGWIFMALGWIGIGIQLFLIRAITPTIIIPITIIVIAVILIIIAAILTIQAWGRLQTFFENNMTMFPGDICEDAKKGAKYLKIAAILEITIILNFIGPILKIIGYNKLASLSHVR
ncbi:MAG: hypothetical protein EU529_09090 [Promethearchaeota archaeon]|nr:MAG: hypothetical protein EU529_09090 [Candidatus Lokiarchaeota archaeon]